MNLQSDQKREVLKLSLTFVICSCNKVVLESDEMLVYLRIYALYTGMCLMGKYVHIICICIVCLNLSCTVNYTVLALTHPLYCATKTSSTCSLLYMLTFMDLENRYCFPPVSVHYDNFCYYFHLPSHQLVYITLNDEKFQNLRSVSGHIPTLYITIFKLFRGLAYSHGKFFTCMLLIMS